MIVDEVTGFRTVVASVETVAPRSRAWCSSWIVGASALSALANFAWLPYQPVWGSIMIAISIAVIWALTVHGRDLARA